MGSVKGQSVVIRELFAFGMGVIVMIAVVSIFNNIVSPKIQEYSVNEQAYSMLFHVHSLFEKVDYLAASFGNNSLSFQQELPSLIGNQHYRIYVNGDQLCVKTSGNIILKRCINMTVDAVVSGDFLSGDDLMINYSFNGSDSVINFDNVVSYVSVCNVRSCDDGNVCTIDSCVGFSCFYNVLTGQQSGCYSSVGCSADYSFDKFCSCSSGSCSNVCGDGVCDYGLGERVWNCYADCGLVNLLLQQENYDGEDDVMLSLNGVRFSDGYVVGNNSIFYNPHSELVDSNSVFLSDRVVSVFINNNERDIYYSVFDGSWSGPVKLTDEPLRHIIEDRLSLGTVNDSFDLIYLNCTGSNDGCDVWFDSYFNDSGFSSPVKVTDLGVDESYFDGADSFFVSTSYNSFHKIILWCYNGFINYTVYDGSWSSITNLVYDSSIDGCSKPSINDDGDILFVYDNNSDSSNRLFYYNGSWFNLGVFNDSLTLALDDDFMVVSVLDGGFINTSFFDGFSFTDPVSSFTREGNVPISLIRLAHLQPVYQGMVNYLLFGLFWNGSDWVMPTNVTYCGNSVCEFGECCNVDCSTETYFNDTVDNDEDGLVDGADPDSVNNGVCDRGESYLPDCRVETWCTDGVDNDEDGLIDSADPDCFCGNSQCQEFESCSADCSSETYCSDGYDNDADGLTDGADPDCCGNGVCEKFESCSADCSSEVWCYDSVDNDADGLTDSVDSSECTCGNGVCDTGENAYTCYRDCSADSMLVYTGNKVFSLDYFNDPYSSGGSFNNKSLFFNLPDDILTVFEGFYDNHTGFFFWLFLNNTGDLSTMWSELNYSFWDGVSWSAPVCLRGCNHDMFIINANGDFDAAGVFHLVFDNLVDVDERYIYRNSWSRVSGWGDDVLISQPDGCESCDNVYLTASKVSDKVFIVWNNETYCSASDCGVELVLTDPYVINYTFFNGSDWINGSFPYEGHSVVDGYFDLGGPKVVFNSSDDLMLTYVNRSNVDFDIWIYNDSDGSFINYTISNTSSTSYRVMFSLFNGSDWTDPDNVTANPVQLGASSNNNVVLSRNGSFIVSRISSDFINGGLFYLINYYNGSWNPMEYNLKTVNGSFFSNKLLLINYFDDHNGSPLFFLSNNFMSPFIEDGLVSFDNYPFSSVDVTHCSNLTHNVFSTEYPYNNYSFYTNGCPFDGSVCSNLGCERFESCSADCYDEFYCSDGVDNDADGLTDDADPDCGSLSAETYCSDGVDNDGDGFVDLRDSDCTCGDGYCVGDEKSYCIADCGITDFSSSCYSNIVSYFNDLTWSNGHNSYRPYQLFAIPASAFAFPQWTVFNRYYTNNFFTVLSVDGAVNVLGWNYTSGSYFNHSQELPGSLLFSALSERSPAVTRLESNLTRTYVGLFYANDSGLFFGSYNGSMIYHTSQLITNNNYSFSGADFVGDRLLTVYEVNWSDNDCTDLTYNYSLDDGVSWGAGSDIFYDCSGNYNFISNSLFVSNPLTGDGLLVWRYHYNDGVDDFYSFRYSYYDGSTDSFGPVGIIDSNPSRNRHPSLLLPYGDDFYLFVENSSYNQTGTSVYLVPDFNELSYYVYDSSADSWSGKSVIGCYKDVFGVGYNNFSDFFISFVEPFNNDSFGAFHDDLSSPRLIFNSSAFTHYPFNTSSSDVETVYPIPFLFGNNTLSIFSYLGLTNVDYASPDTLYYYALNHVFNESIDGFNFTGFDFVFKI